MRNINLTYCTNVHSQANFADWEDIVGYFGSTIRANLGWPQLPLGLWFNASLLAEMSRDRVKSLLAENHLSTFTFNAFPYGNFHQKVVKTKVYHPDWTEASRLDYTVACARLLAFLLPEGGEGSVSTLPLGWRVGWTPGHSRRAAEQLCAWVGEARILADTTGRIIRLGLEPEPGCILENIDQVIAFWNAHLLPAAEEAGLSPETLQNFCGVCYDTCHQAVQFEDPVEVLDKLAAAGIRVVKMQLSNALEFLPDPERRSQALRRQFTEEKFLHQTRVHLPGGIAFYDDLPEALDKPDLDWGQPWRVHFHLPIDAADLLDPEWIGTTRADMLKAYRHALDKDLCRHFEVETYTWSVLPPAYRPATRADLAHSLARELKFIADKTPDGVALNA